MSELSRNILHPGIAASFTCNVLSLNLSVTYSPIGII